MSKRNIKYNQNLSLPSGPGVYFIKNTRTGKVYVGQSENIRRRAASHIYELKSNKHSSKAMQEDWNSRLSDDEFEFVVACTCDKESLLEKEKDLIKITVENGNCYNKIVYDGGAGDTTAAARQAAHRQRQREAGLVELRGVWVPAELAEQARKVVAELVERERAEKNAALIRGGYSGMWKCTICGRVGSVGRCCGDETREPADAAPHKGRQ